MDSKKKTCHRSGQTIYPADKQVHFGPDGDKGFDFLHVNFTCKSTGTRLTLKTAVMIDGEVYLRGECGAVLGAGSGKVLMDTNPTPSGVIDVNGERVGEVPDANMKTNSRMFNIAGKQEHRGTKGEDQGSNYGDGAVAVETAVNNPDPGMRTDARRFHIADADGNNYDANGVVINTHLTVERPPTVVQNVNMREVRHNMGGEGKNMADGGDGKYRGVERGDDEKTTGSMYAPSL